MLQFVGCLVVTDVSKDRNAFILRVKQSKSTLLLLLDPEDDSIMVLQNCGNYLPVLRAFHLRRLEVSAWILHV
jgi:hypothetical protein